MLSMKTQYDPNVAPPAVEWLKLGEARRIDLVTTYHQRAGISTGNDRLHAIIHVIVETQLALGESVVMATHDRLKGGGLTRHDAIHAIGSVLTGHLQRLMTDRAPDRETERTYDDGLRSLTARSWKGGS